MTILSGLSKDKIRWIAEETSELSERYPLHSVHGKQFTIGEFTSLSGLQCISLLAVAVDILSNGQISDKEMAFREWLPLAKKISINTVLSGGDDENTTT